MHNSLNKSIKAWISMHYRNLQLRLRKKTEVNAWEQPLFRLPKPNSFKILTHHGFWVQVFNVRYYYAEDKHIVAFITNPHEKDWGVRAFDGSTEGQRLASISRFSEAGCKVYRYEFPSCPDKVKVTRFRCLLGKLVQVRLPYDGPSENIISTLCFERLDLLRDWVLWHKKIGFTMFIIYVNHDLIPRRIYNEVNSLGVQVNWMSWPFPYYHRTRVWPIRDMHWAQPSQMVDAMLHLSSARKGSLTNIDTDEFIYNYLQPDQDIKTSAEYQQVEIRNVWATLPNYIPGRLNDQIRTARIFDAWSSKEEIQLWASDGITRFKANSKQRGKCSVKLPLEFCEIPLPHQILPSQECPLEEKSILLHFADIAGRRKFGNDIPWSNLHENNPMY